MDKDIGELWGAARQLGPFVVVVLFISVMVIRQLWLEMKELRKENREIYEARVADAIAAAQLTREMTAVMTQASETNRAVVEYFRSRRES